MKKQTKMNQQDKIEIPLTESISVWVLTSFKQQPKAFFPVVLSSFWKKNHEKTSKININCILTKLLGACNVQKLVQIHNSRMGSKMILILFFAGEGLFFSFLFHNIEALDNGFKKANFRYFIDDLLCLSGAKTFKLLRSCIWSQVHSSRSQQDFQKRAGSIIQEAKT